MKAGIGAIVWSGLGITGAAIVLSPESDRQRTKRRARVMWPWWREKGDRRIATPQ